MKKKIIGILICTLLFATTIPIVGSMNVGKTRIIGETFGSDDQSTTWIDENYIPQLIKEEYEKKRLESHQEIKDTRGWYWKSPYPNYAPSGMPDFSQQQDQWKTIRAGSNGYLDSLPYLAGDDFHNATKNCIAPGPNCKLETPRVGDDTDPWTFCGPVAVANCFWWLDSKYADSTGTPGDGKDIFPLVQNYTAGVDDHSAANVPLLICELAKAMNVCERGTTHIDDMEDAIDKWLINTGLSNFTRKTEDAPTFEYIEDQIKSCHDVILQIGFYSNCYNRYGGHFVTCAGVNSEEFQIAISDPDRDVREGAMGNSNDHPPHPEDQTVHNDTKYVSHDIFNVSVESPCSNLPYKCYFPDYIGGYYTFIERAVVIYRIIEEGCFLQIVNMTGGLLDFAFPLLRVKAVIKNNGTAECKNVSWSFNFSGGIILSGPNSGTIPSILPGTTAPISSKIVIGYAGLLLLPGNVTITADAANNACPPASETKDIIVIGLLLKVKP